MTPPRATQLTPDRQHNQIGKPCYGYRVKKVPHPVPAKRPKGVKKTRLEADPVEGAVVRKAFGWRVVERLGYQAIAERLNADLVANPPPTPVDPAAAAGLWTYSIVRDMLTNPKHTGHMVWNRRARKGSGKNRMNPVSEWVWSAEPVQRPSWTWKHSCRPSRSPTAVSVPAPPLG